MAKRYRQYCPIAHALGLVGERWALLIVRNLMHGPQRYSDLAGALPGIGTNILAARLRDLEASGIVRKHRLPPPAASQVYELTDYGARLKPVLRQLAQWGAESLGPPDDAELDPGWLVRALDLAVLATPTDAAIEFRVGDEVASIVAGEAHVGALTDADAVVETDADGFYRLVVERSFDDVRIEGDTGVVEQLVGRLGTESPRVPA